MKLLVLGSRGYLGKRLTSELRQSGHDVIGLSHETSGAETPGLIYFPELPNCKAIDAVINCAVCYGQNRESWTALMEANLLYPMRVFQWAAQNNVKYFINTGTSITHMINPYTLSKKQFVQWGKLGAEQWPIHFVNIVLEHFCGPHESENNFLTMLLHRIARHEDHIDLTGGMQLRDFIYIDDVIAAYQSLLKHLPEIQEASCDIPVGGGVPYRISEIAKLIKTQLNSPTQLRFGALPYRKHEIMYSCANISRLEHWGWRPQYSLEQAIDKIIKEEAL